MRRCASVQFFFSIKILCTKIVQSIFGGKGGISPSEPGYNINKIFAFSPARFFCVIAPSRTPFFCLLAAVVLAAHAPRRECSILFFNKNTLHKKCAEYFWRKRRDLNPRAGHPTYTLSRGASSAS